MVNLNVSNSSTHFQQGMNTIIVPRAIALGCQLNDSLADISTLPSSDPFYGATFHSTQGGSGSSHVVAVITKTVNGAVAESILYMLTHDYDDVRIGNNVTISADNVYLLHLPKDVVSSIPTIIQNSGLGASPNYLDPLNVIADIVDMVFNFLVYVYNTVTLYLQHLLDIGLQNLGSLVNASAAAVTAALNAIVDAFVAFVEYVIDLVISVCMGFVDSILVPLSEIWLGYCQGIAYAMSLMVDDQKNLGYVTDSSKMALLQAFQGDFFW